MVDIGVTASAKYVCSKEISTSGRSLLSDTIHVTVSRGSPSAQRTKLTYVWYLVIPAIRTVSVGDHVRPSVSPCLCACVCGGGGGGQVYFPNSLHRLPSLPYKHTSWKAHF